MPDAILPLRPTLPLAATLLLAALTAVPARAAESFEGCTYEITTLPAVLSSQGVWCLKGDLATGVASGQAITVAANNVTIACNGFKLGGLGAGAATQAIGIFGSGRNNTTIRGCNIRGFNTGVYFHNSSGTLVEDSLFDGNTFVGIHLGSLGSSASVIRRNRVIDTGGSTVDLSPSGIVASNDAHVIDNIVTGVQATAAGTAHGISGLQFDGTITGNRVAGLVRDTGAARYIFLQTSGRAIVDGNFIQGDGSANSVGILCETTLAVARENVLLGVATGVENCDSISNFHDPV